MALHGTIDYKEDRGNQGNNKTVTAMLLCNTKRQYYAYLQSKHKLHFGFVRQDGSKWNLDNVESTLE